MIRLDVPDLVERAERARAALRRRLLRWMLWQLLPEAWFTIPACRLVEVLAGSPAMPGLVHLAGRPAAWGAVVGGWMGGTLVVAWLAERVHLWLTPPPARRLCLGEGLAPELLALLRPSLEPGERPVGLVSGQSNGRLGPLDLSFACAALFWALAVLVEVALRTSRVGYVPNGEIRLMLTAFVGCALLRVAAERPDLVAAGWAGLALCEALLLPLVCHPVALSLRPAAAACAFVAVPLYVFSLLAQRTAHLLFTDRRVLAFGQQPHSALNNGVLRSPRLRGAWPRSAELLCSPDCLTVLDDGRRVARLWLWADQPESPAELRELGWTVRERHAWRSPARLAYALALIAVVCAGSRRVAELTGPALVLNRLVAPALEAARQHQPVDLAALAQAAASWPDEPGLQAAVALTYERLNRTAEAQAAWQRVAQRVSGRGSLVSALRKRGIPPALP